MLHNTTISMRRHLKALLFVAAIALGACDNSRYVDLMRVTSDTEVVIHKWTETYEGSGPLHQRTSARERIVRLREKQVVLAERIDPETIPEYQNKTITLEQSRAKKDSIVAAAVQRYNDAVALPYPTESDRKK